MDRARRPAGSPSRIRSDAGFTLIEILIVVLIIGLLAAIAIPLFVNQQMAAHKAAVESDVHHLAIQLETSKAQNDGAYLVPEEEDVLLTSGVAVDLYLDAQGLTYYLVASNQHLNGGATLYYFGTAEGGVIGWSDADGFVTPAPLPDHAGSYSNAS